MKKVKWTLLGGVATFVVAIVIYKLIVLAGGYMMDEKQLVFHSSSRIVDQKGKEITKLYVENRELVPTSKFRSMCSRRLLRWKILVFMSIKGLIIRLYSVLFIKIR